MGISRQVGTLRPGICTSSTRPVNPYAGQIIFETDTIQTLQYNGSIWVLVLSANAVTPVGAVIDFAGTSAPANYLVLQGQAITNGQTVYPALWAVIPAGWKSGSNIILPDVSGRISVAAGAGPGLTSRPHGTMGGTETEAAPLPVHSHTIGDPGHNHSQNAHGHTISDSGHQHSVVSYGSLGGSYDQIMTDYNGGGGNVAAVPNNISSISAASGAFYASNSATGILINNITATNNAAFTGQNATTNSGAGGDHNNMPPFLVLTKIIRVR